MSNKNQILDLIDDLVSQQTFSLEAIKAIEELRTKAKNLEEDLDKVSDKNQMLHSSINDMAVEVNTLQNTIDRLSKENDLLKQHKEKADQSIYEAIKHKAVADAYRDAMQIVFKPSVMRDSISRSIAVPMGNGVYPSIQNETETVIKEEIHS